MQVTIYSTPTCAYCKRAKEYVEARGIAYEEINVAESEERANELVEKSGQMGVPVIVVRQNDGSENLIVGFRQAELDKLLASEV